MKTTDETLSQGLYIVATPIGNMQDITLRAIDVLSKVDVIFCEDTRETGKLAVHHGWKAPLKPYHDHNSRAVETGILKLLADGLRIGLVSDAGMPLISDPGFGLVRAATEAGHFVTCIPGASASLMALVLSGLPTDRFYFAGFLPAKTTARQKELQNLKAIPATLVFYETAPRLIESLADMQGILGDRNAAVARELTKKFEEIRRGSLSLLSGHYAETGAPRGEIVIIVSGAAGETIWDLERLDSEIKKALKKGQSIKDLSIALAETSGHSRKDIYARALALKDGP
jgi:16S rRNA (cytidine1402-2'-O)-methyltransferase